MIRCCDFCKIKSLDKNKFSVANCMKAPWSNVAIDHYNNYVVVYELMNSYIIILPKHVSFLEKSWLSILELFPVSAAYTNFPICA